MDEKDLKKFLDEELFKYLDAEKCKKACKKFSDIFLELKMTHLECVVALKTSLEAMYKVVEMGGNNGTK